MITMEMLGKIRRLYLRHQFRSAEVSVAAHQSTPLSNSGPKSDDDKPPPAKSARMVQPGIEANRSCSGVEFMVGKDLFVLTNVFLDNSHCTNHLRCSLPFLCKIQVSKLAHAGWSHLMREL